MVYIIYWLPVTVVVSNYCIFVHRVRDDVVKVCVLRPS